MKNKTCTVLIFLTLAAWVSARDFTVRDAVEAALSSDARVESAVLDLTASQLAVTEAERKRIPGLVVSGAYSRLSDVTSTVNLGPTSFALDSQNDAISFRADLQYPVFAGYRLKESIHLAQLQSQGKEISAEMARRAVIFETERAYWEAVRAIDAVNTLRENLALMERNRAVTKEKLDQGIVLNADLLAAQMRYDQAEMDFQGGQTNRDRAMIALETLVGADGSSPIALVSQPEEMPALDTTDETGLIQHALTERPEMRAFDLSAGMTVASRNLAAAPLYPTLAVTGDYTFANPNPRVAFQSDPEFAGTWTVGVSLSYDLGGVPAHISAVEAQDTLIRKNVADRDGQEAVVKRDVRMCLLVFNQAKADLDIVSRMVEQAKENERVMEQRVRSGTASDLDVLTASIARLRSEFTVVNKQIDLQIAAADLRRSAALAIIE